MCREIYLFSVSWALLIYIHIHMIHIYGHKWKRMYNAVCKETNNYIFLTYIVLCNFFRSLAPLGSITSHTDARLRCFSLCIMQGYFYWITSLTYVLMIFLLLIWCEFERNAVQVWCTYTQVCDSFKFDHGQSRQIMTI